MVEKIWFLVFGTVDAEVEDWKESFWVDGCVEEFGV